MMHAQAGAAQKYFAKIPDANPDHPIYLPLKKTADTFRKTPIELATARAAGIPMLVIYSIGFSH